MTMSALLLVFDAGNIVCQGCTTDEVFAEYLATKRGLGWMHIKDYRLRQCPAGDLK